MPSNVLNGTDMVKKRFIERRVAELTDGYMVTDAIFMRDPSDAQVIVYEENTNGLTNDEKSGEVEQRAEGGNYPRVTLTAEQKQAIIKDYGLEIPITYEAVKFNRVSSINRAYIVLGNSLIRYVDQRGLKVLTDNYNAASTKINTVAVGTAWSSGTADPFGDLISAGSKVESFGYEANVALVHPDDYASAIKNKDFRKEIDTDVPPERKVVRKGLIIGLVGNLTLIKAKNIQKGMIWVGQDQVIGNRSETSNGNEIDVYDEKPGFSKTNKIVSAFREVEHYMTDPKAGCLLSGV